MSAKLVEDLAAKTLPGRICRADFLGGQREAGRLTGGKGSVRMKAINGRRFDRERKE